MEAPKGIIITKFKAGDKVSIRNKKRTCFTQLKEYILGKTHPSKVCIIYGLRRSGKTELMKQCIDELGDKKERAIYIECENGANFYDLINFIDNECDNYDYFFIDEITKSDGFQKIGEILANTFVNLRHKKIVITGTDSLGLSLPSHDSQYERSFFVHTTYFPFAEYSEITGCISMDEYIRKGCALSDNLGENIFRNKKETDKYIRTSITKNLIRSIEKSEEVYNAEEALTEIYTNDEMKSAIEKIINQYYGNITMRALRKEYRSGMIGNGIDHMMTDREEPVIDMKTKFDEEKANEHIMDILGIKKNNETITKFEQKHLDAIKGFLKEIDVFEEMPEYDVQNNDRAKDTSGIIIHPGIFHATIKYTLDEIQKNDDWFIDVPKDIKKRLIQKSEEDILGHIMENIVLKDTKEMLQSDETLRAPEYNDGRWYVSKLKMTANRPGETNREIDMFILDKKENEVYLFEIKHSREHSPLQHIHLLSKEVETYVSKELGAIKGRYVLYNGTTSLYKEDDGVARISAVDFLTSLYDKTDKGQRSDSLELKRCMDEILDKYLNIKPIDLNNITHAREG